MRKQALKNNIEEYKEIIDGWMHKVDPKKYDNAKAITESIVGILDIAHRRKELKAFLEETQYSVFDWAIQNYNVDVLDFLLQKLSPEYHFLMIEHDHYKPIRQFVKTSLHISTFEYQKVRSIIEEILSKIISIDPKAIIPFIRQYIANKKQNQNCNITSDAYSALEESLESAQKLSITIRQVLPLTLDELKLEFFKEKVRTLERKVGREKSQEECELHPNKRQCTPSHRT